MKTAAGTGWRRTISLIAAATVMMCGYGLAFSFTAVYLAQLPGAGPQTVGAYFAVTGAVGVVTGALMSTSLGRVAPAPACAVAIVVAMTAFAALATSNSVGWALVAAAGVGASTAIFQATIIPLLQAVTPADGLRTAFAVRYQASNVALAVGVSVAGLLIDRHGVVVMRTLLLVVCAAHVPLLLLLISGRAMWRRTDPAAPPSTENARSRSLLSRRLVLLMLFQAGAGILIFPHLESTLPLVVGIVEHGPAVWLTAAVLANLLGVLVLQVPVVRLLECRPAADGLKLATTVWIATHAVVLVLSMAGGLSPVVALVAYGLLVALGECAYSASFMPLLIETVPPHVLTQASSLANTVGTLGTLVGPSLGALLVGSGSQMVVWSVLFVGNVVVLLPATVFAVRPGARLGVAADSGPDLPSTRSPARQ
ncbi:MAG TPA: hypothetical protein VE781_11260 [Kineosporiaceae bacterium]|jgi:MFS family permease|nr:hypothetical protein [Kineosporiaceae bacterium]